jgi:hypothetical protein
MVIPFSFKPLIISKSCPSESILIKSIQKKMNNFKSKKIKLLKNLNNNVLTEYRVKENLFSTKEDFKVFKNFKMNNIQKK